MVIGRFHLIYATLVLILLVPVWAPQYFPTLDGPAHLHVAEAWLDLGRDADSPRATLYERIDTIHANYLIYPLLWGLLTFFSPIISEKILLTVYVLFFCSCAIYFCRSLSRESFAYSILLVPIALMSVIILGFFNHAFGVAVFMAFLGFWWRHRQRMSPSAIAGYAAIGVLLYLTHLMALVLTGFAIAVMSLAWLLDAYRRLGLARWRHLLRGFAGRAVAPALPTLPLLIFGLRVTGQDDAFREGAGGIALEWPSWPKILLLFSGQPIKNHSEIEWLSAAVFMILIVVMGRSIIGLSGKRSIRSSFFVLSASITVLYLVLPNQFLIDWVYVRLLPYVYVAWIGWLISALAAQPKIDPSLPWPLRQRVVVATVAGIIVFSSGARTMRVLEIDGFIQEYVSVADEIAQGSTLLGLRLDLPEAEALSPADLFLQTVGYVAMATRGIDLRNWQVHTGMFPVRFRDGLDPYHALASDTQFVWEPLSIRPTDYQRTTGHAVDYVLLWGHADSLVPGSPLDDDLRRHYTHVHTTEPRGVMRLFRLAE